MKPMRADDVKMANLTSDRSNGIKPFMIPAKLNNQVRVGEGSNDLLFQPVGKTPWGGTRWSIIVQRPGMLTPTIVSKKEQQSMNKMAAAINAGSAIPTTVDPLAKRKNATAAAAGAPATDAKAASTIGKTISAVNSGASQAPKTVAGWLYY